MSSFSFKTVLNTHIEHILDPRTCQRRAALLEQATCIAKFIVSCLFMASYLAPAEGPAFSASRTVYLKDLSKAERKKWIQFLCEEDIQVCAFVH